MMLIILRLRRVSLRYKDMDNFQRWLSGFSENETLVLPFKISKPHFPLQDSSQLHKPYLIVQFVNMILRNVGQGQHWAGHGRIDYRKKRMRSTI